MKDRLNRLWRIFATGLAFVIFSAGGLLLSVTWLPLIQVFTRDPERRRRRTRGAIQASFRFFMRLLGWFGLCYLHVHDRERLENIRGGTLVLANHPCLLDVVCLVGLVPDAECVVKQALWWDPFLKRVVNAAGYISNSDPEALLRACVEALEAGRPLILFPEGTRTRPGRPLKFHRGAARIALTSNAPILPVIMGCRPRTLTKETRWYQVPSKPAIISVEPKEPKSVSDFIAAEDLPEPARVRRLTRALENYFTGEGAENEYADTGT